MSYAHNKSHRPGRAKRIAITLLIVAAALVLAGRFLLYPYIMDRVAVQTVSTALSGTDAAAGLTSDELTDAAQQVLSSMDEQDRKTVESIISSHLDRETVTKASSYLASGDTAGLRDYLSGSLSDEEMAELESLYAKYQDEIDAAIQSQASGS